MERARRFTGNFILMMKLRKKILTFRDAIDLPPCDGTESITELVSRTLKDLHEFHPDVISRSQLSEIKGASIDKVLVYYCEALKAFGDSWTKNQEWMDKLTSDKFSNIEKFNTEKLLQMALAMLNCVIKITKEKSDISDEDEQNKDSLPDEQIKDSLPASLFRKILMESSESSTSCCASPVTPTSVLPTQFMTSPNSDVFANISCSSPVLRSLRVQAVGKLNPIHIKRLSFQIPPSEGAQGYGSWNLKNNENDEVMEEVEAESKCLNPKSNADEEMMFEMEASSNSEVTEVAKEDDARDCCAENGSPEIEMLETTETSEVTELITPTSPPTPLLIPTMTQAPPAPTPLLIPSMSQVNVGETLPPPVLQSNVVAPSLLSPPPPPFVLQPNLKAQQPPSTQPLPPPVLQPNKPTAEVLLPPPTPESQPNVAAAGAPKVLPPPPPPMTSGTVNAALPGRGAPPPLSPTAQGGAPPPPAMAQENRGASPPPPPGAGRSLRPKKAQTKLRRSSQMGNLYRVLKGKVEGGNPNVKQASGRKGSAPANSGGKQGMADALAEITKKSAYFQQIEEDVQKYSNSITALKSSISTFKNKDMNELITYHKYVESILENLADETQVLARFEGFPQKKLEAIRTAAALYAKLNGIVTELQNWKIVTPLGQLLDRTERYLNKIKGELDALERTKDEESKRFQSQNINFDFQILVQIKEAIVDVSSNCMELALKERKSGKTTDSKILWGTFQFAFKVYSFAGGQDDRADALTRELAQEIEADSPQQYH
uniref:Hydroxyproline-rich glycoprotein family protein n=1 Tax=Manihot esculenta TaxID=3983 RepID=A0A2C9U5U6_MANES